MSEIRGLLSLKKAQNKYYFTIRTSLMGILELVLSCLKRLSYVGRRKRGFELELA